MKVPRGFIAKLWSFVSFLPFFLLLLSLGLLKGIKKSILKFMGEKFHNHHLRNRQSLSFRGDNWPNCGSDNGGRKFVGSYRTFAGAFLLDILLCSQVTSSELRKIESISNYFISQFSDLFGYWICRTKRVGWVLKLLVLLFLPLPLVLWPVVAIVGSLLGGIGFGFFSPLITTFEFIGTDHKDKCFHCFVVSRISIKHQKMPD